MVLLAALVLAAMSALSPNGLRKAWRFGKEIERLRAENAAIEAENERLRRDIQNLHASPAYLERVARDELGLVRPGEVLFRFPEGGVP